MLETKRSTILIVDDSITNLKVLADALVSDYRVLAARSGKEALERLHGKIIPDLVLLDVLMEGMDGYEVLAKIKEDIRFKDLPVIFLTGMDREEDEAKGFALGALDYIRKPFSVQTVKSRVWLQLEFVRRRNLLEDLVAKRTVELVDTQKEVILRLASASEYRDNDTGTHITRIMDYTKVFARHLGWDEKTCELLYHASSMHDVGKIGIPDRVLLKPGKLDPEEWEIMKTHTTIGASLLAGHDAEILVRARSIALTHHEKWDGTGYPNGLKGEEIPLEGRIVAICDVFDALLSKRSYKTAWSNEDALDEINKQASRQFDPEMVKVFNKILPEMLAIRQKSD